MITSMRMTRPGGLSSSALMENIRRSGWRQRREVRAASALAWRPAPDFPEALGNQMHLPQTIGRGTGVMRSLSTPDLGGLRATDVVVTESAPHQSYGRY